MSLNKTVIITGASSGIGLGLVKAFLARGYNVVGNARSLPAWTLPPPSSATRRVSSAWPATSLTRPLQPPSSAKPSRRLAPLTGW